MSLQTFLQQCDENFDPQTNLVWSNAGTPGYHTRIADGTRVHDTRHAMDYAVACLRSAEPWRAERACEVIDAIAAIQVTDPLAQHFGIWGWFYEEPPQQMNPADWNWADFLGARLAQALVKHSDQLREDTRERAKSALRLAALAIFRRNTPPTYTNIAVMGAVVSVAAGELLAMPDLVDYGRRRLAAVFDLARRTGGFNEYNSPTYTRVAMEEAERCLMLVSDPATRESAQGLRYIAWQALAERFHPATGQMAGPMSRAYSDWVQEGLAQYLSEQTGATIQARVAPDAAGKQGSKAHFLPVQPLPCPPELAERFKRLPKDPLEVVTRFATTPDGDTIGTTWLTADACLGSVNRGHGWVQQRGVLGYWKTSEDPAVALRVRLLKDGIDLAASRLESVQRGPRVLASWCLAYDSGAFHPVFDKADSFEIGDLRMRISLSGRGLDVKPLDDARFALSAGDWQAIVQTAGAEFGGKPVRWEMGRDADGVFVDALLYRGPKVPISFLETRVKLAFGMEVLPKKQAPLREPVVAQSQEDERVRWTWSGMELLAPTRPAAFAW